MAGILEAIRNLFSKKENEAEQAANAAGNTAQDVQNTAEGAVEDVKDKVGDVIDGIKDKLPDIGSFFDSILGKLPIDGELGDQVNEVIGSVRSSAPADADVRSIGGSIIEALTAKFGLEGPIGEKIKAVIEFIKSKLPI